MWHLTVRLDFFEGMGGRTQAIRWFTLTNTSFSNPHNIWFYSITKQLLVMFTSFPSYLDGGHKHLWCGIQIVLQSSLQGSSLNLLLEFAQWQPLERHDTRLKWTGMLITVKRKKEHLLISWTRLFENQLMLIQDQKLTELFLFLCTNVFGCLCSA